jgi:hypothetical protein
MGDEIARCRQLVASGRSHTDQAETAVAEMAKGAEVPSPLLLALLDVITARRADEALTDRLIDQVEALGF